METTNGNKIALAVLGALLGTMALGVFCNAIFAPNRLRSPATRCPPAAEAAARPPPQAGARDPLPGGARQGRRRQGPDDTKICQACHTFDKGGPLKVGPPLWGVVGRPKGSFPGFNYEVEGHSTRPPPAPSSPP